MKDGRVNTEMEERQVTKRRKGMKEIKKKKKKEERDIETQRERKGKLNEERKCY